MSVSNFKWNGEARARSGVEKEHKDCNMRKEGLVFVLFKKI